LNPNWDENWRMPLAYRRTTVVKDDIPRLDEGECLNDNIIGFYLRYLFSELEASRPEVAKRLYFHNSYFYDNLKPTKGRGINYDSVKNWTAKVDLFSYDYIIVPVNEHFHWWVAIICNPGRMDPAAASTSDRHVDEDDDDSDEISIEMEIRGASNEQGSRQMSYGDPMDIDSDPAPQGVPKSRGSTPSRMSIDSVGEFTGTAFSKALEGRQEGGVAKLDGNGTQMTSTAAKTSSQKARKSGKKAVGPGPRKYSPEDPRIITLDSLGTSHSPACTHLKHYLIAELKDKKDRVMDYAQPIGMKATNIPEQNNFCDCGVYLLGYVQEFLKDPDTFVRHLLLREQKKWDFDASETRNDLRKLIFDLHEEYQSEQEKLRRRKAEAKRMKQASSPAGPARDAELKPQVAKDGGSRSVSAQPQDSRPGSHPGTTPPAVKSPTPDLSKVKGKPAHSDKAPDYARPSGPGHASPRPAAAADGEVRGAASGGVAAGGDQASRGVTWKRPASRVETEMRSPLSPSEPRPSIELADSVEDSVRRARHPAPKSSPRADRPEVVASIEKPHNDDLELLKPIPSTSPSTASQGQDRPRQATSSTNFRRLPLSRESAGESSRNKSGKDVYAMSSSPSPAAKGHDTGSRGQDPPLRSPYFPSHGVTRGGGTRSFPRRGKEHGTIDLTDD